MFDIGWTEMLVVAVVAIIVVGPKDLPGMLRTFGRTIKKVRAMAGDFQKQFDEAISDAELDGLKDTVNDVRSLDPTKAIKDKLNPLKSDDKSEKKIYELDIDDEETALAKQRKIDEEFAKVAPSSGANAVPGFGGPAADPLPVEPAPKAKTKAAAKKPAAKSAAAKKAPAKKATAKKTTAKKPAAKKPAAQKTAAKAKPAAKKTAPKKPAAKKPKASKPTAKAKT